MSDSIKEKYQALHKRMAEFSLEPEQLAAKLSEILDLAILSEEERINPKLSDPVSVKVRNLPVALATVKTMIELSDKIRLESVEQSGGQGEGFVYEMVQTWVAADQPWTGGVQVPLEQEDSVSDG